VTLPRERSPAAVAVDVRDPDAAPPAVAAGGVATPEQRVEIARLRKALSIVSVLFAALHVWYRVFADRIHAASPATPPAVVNAGLRMWVLEHDGVELFAMFAAVTATLATAYVLTSRVDRVPWFRSGLAQLGCAVPALVILAGVHMTSLLTVETPATRLAAARLVAACLGAVAGAVGLWWTRTAAIGPRPRRAVALLCYAALGVVVVGGASPAVPFDYGFFVGPARKLAAGESLGSFYMQYGVLGTYLFRGLVAAELRLHEMQAVLSALCVAWLGLYYWLARKLFDDRFLRYAFVCALVVVRFLAIMGGPTMLPQVSVFRLDLWVPLALVLLRFGYASPVTGLAFCLTYLADDVFGFLYLAFYGVVWLATVVADRAARRRSSPAAVGGAALAMAASLAAHWAVFGTVTNPAAKLYQGVHIGMLPIETSSLLWLVLLFLLAAFHPILRDPDPTRRSRTMMLFAFAAAQLTYFYGRSQDHNLINLSGVFLLIFFVALDRLPHCGVRPRTVYALASWLVAATAAAYSAPAAEKLATLRSRLSRGVLIEPIPLDREIDRSPDLFDVRLPGRPLLVFSRIDAYLNYRYGIPQVGYFAPLYANVFVEETAEMLRSRLAAGYDVLLCWSEPEDVAALNATRAMANARARFVVRPLSARVSRVELRAGGD
jgi:hypothetical protein